MGGADLAVVPGDGWSLMGHGAAALIQIANTASLNNIDVSFEGSSAQVLPITGVVPRGKGGHNHYFCTFLKRRVSELPKESIRDLYLELAFFGKTASVLAQIFIWDRNKRQGHRCGVAYVHSWNPEASAPWIYQGSIILQ